MTRRAKPIIHGRDHAPDGPDPIPTTTGGGIQFDTYPQDGGWLYLNTTDTSEAGGAFDNWAINIRDTSTGGGISLETNYSSRWWLHDGVLLLETDKDAGTDTPGSSSTGIELKAWTDVIRIGGKWVYLQAVGTAAEINLAHDGSVNVSGSVLNITSPVNLDGGGSGAFRIGSTGDNLGFVGATPAPRQPHPSTLADVINVLQTFGLTS